MTEECWLIFNDKSHGADANMAIDALLFNQVKQPLLRFYSWDKPAISIGVSQRYTKTLRDGFDLVRRQTGGGVVDHSNSYTYTLVFPANHHMVSEDTLVCYQRINEAVKKAILNMDFSVDLTAEEIDKDVPRDMMACSAHPTKYDIVQNSSKISGCAQRRTKNGVLHQGYISNMVGDEVELRKQIVKELAQSFGCSWTEFKKWNNFDQELAQLVEEQYGNEVWSKRR